MKARRFFTALGIFLVTVVAGAISYRHQSELALHNGQPQLLAAIWPACVDGLVMSCGIAIATDRAGGFRPRPWALLGFWVGVVVSVLTNWLATSGGPIAHAVSAFPAIAFLIAVESLSSKPRLGKKSADAENLPAKTADAENASAPMITGSNLELKIDDLGRKDETVPVSPSHVTPPKTRRVPTAAAKVAAAARKLPDGTPAAIAAKAGVSESTARRHLAPTLASPASIGNAPVPISDDVTERVNGHSLVTVPS